MINPMELTGKKILIAGASGGIGRYITKRVCELGGDAVALVREESKLQKVMAEIGCKEISCYCHDFYDLDGIENFVKNIIEKEGQWDGFVYSIGASEAVPIRDMTPERLEERMRINYSAFVELVRCLAKRNRYRMDASIVTVSSVSSLKGDKAKLDYCSSKAAMDAAVRCMAYEFTGKKKIRINSIQPAGVNVDMYTEYLADNKESEHVRIKQERQFIGLIDPEEIANVTAFLLSNATKSVSGTSILMDAGMLI